MDASDKRNVRRLRQIGCLHDRCWSRPSDFRDSRGRTECSQTAQEELAQRTLPSWGAIGQALRAKLEGAREWVQGGALIGNHR